MKAIETNGPFQLRDFNQEAHEVELKVMQEMFEALQMVKHTMQINLVAFLQQVWRHVQVIPLFTANIHSRFTSVSRG